MDMYSYVIYVVNGYIATTAKYTLHRLHVAILLQQIAILDNICTYMHIIITIQSAT